jgi:hypothetical protein
LEELIESLKAKTGKEVAVLIDEYDKPITDRLEASGEGVKAALDARDTLRNLYSGIKGNSGHIKLVFITGISRFAKVSLFSDLNNFTDISFEEDYHDVCGYTKEELEGNFRGHLEAVAARRGMSYPELLENAREWYNGYSWDGRNRVYNPFSVLRFLDSKQFGNYWFESGTPKFLMQFLRKGFRFELSGQRVGMATFNNHDVASLNFETLLFQTGYLTVKEKDMFGDFLLGYPNREVEQSMLQHLLIDYGQDVSSPALANNFVRALQAGDIGAFLENANTLFANIPAEIFLPKREAYFHSILYIALKLCGFWVDAEVRTSKGRIDAALRYQNRVWLFEFKLDGSAEEALAQIDEKAYGDGFRGQGLEVMKVGVNFSSVKKEVDGWVCAGA